MPKQLVVFWKPHVDFERKLNFVRISQLAGIEVLQHHARSNLPTLHCRLSPERNKCRREVRCAHEREKGILLRLGHSGVEHGVEVLRSGREDNLVARHAVQFEIEPIELPLWNAIRKQCG